MIQHSFCFSLISGGSTGDTLSVSLYLSLVVSLTALVALVVLLVNCVTCCKEREINFKVRALAGRQPDGHSSTCSQCGPHLMNTEWGWIVSVNSGSVVRDMPCSVAASWQACFFFNPLLIFVIVGV